VGELPGGYLDHLLELVAGEVIGWPGDQGGYVQPAEGGHVQPGELR